MGSSSNPQKGLQTVSGDILLPEIIASNTQLTVSLNEDCGSTQLDAKLGIESHQEGKALYLATCNLQERAAWSHYYCPDQGGIYMSLHLSPDCHLRSSPLYLDAR